MQLLLLVFFIAVGIQIIYFIIFLTAFSKKRNSKQPQTLPVSIIVCAHDEEENLKDLIPLLLAQDHPEFEVIIVDDRSNDTTFDFLLEETKRDHRLRMVHVNRTPPHVNSKKYGITLGMKAAKYEWVLFTDADCRPNGKQWIRSMSAYFDADTRFVLGFSPYTKSTGILNSFIRFETLTTAIQYISLAILGMPYMGVGRNLAYRRSVFLENKGFNNFLTVTGGDDDLFVNQHASGENTAVCLEPESLIFFSPKVIGAAFLNKKKRKKRVGKYYKFRHRLLLGLFSLTWMMSWFLGVPLIFIVPGVRVYWVISVLVVRALLFAITAGTTSKKLGQPFEVWAVLPLDFIYAFYYLVTGLVALVSKKIRWKN